MKKCIGIFCAFLLTMNIVFAQNKADREKIKAGSNLKNLAVLQSKFNKAYQQTINQATKLNIPLTKEFFSKGGRLLETRVLDRIINGVPYYEGEDNIDAAITSGVHKIWKGGTSGLNLTGKDIIIGHWEVSGIPLATHVELENKMIVLEASSSSSHATHTAGSMVGIGVNPLARGMTSSAILHVRKTDNDEAEMAAFAANGGIISNHSYGAVFNGGADVRSFGYYSADAQEWDQIAYNAPYYLICKSAGNTRNDGVNVSDEGYDLLLTKALSKNILTIGAVKDVPEYFSPVSVTQTTFSSYGPTDDWRIKPELVNNGQSLFSSDDDSNSHYSSKSGTSMATPATTGAIVLLQEHYHNKNAAYMKSATVKSLLINTAKEVGANEGPDFANGWGLINAEKAANVITNNAISSLILEETLINNATFQVSFTVDGTKPLALAMAWTDPAGTPLNPATLKVDQDDLLLVNDLDVRITGNGNTYMPWKIDKTFFQTGASKGDNFRDNVEKIDVVNLPAGTYTVTVTHKGQLVNFGQNFSLVINGISSSSLDVADLLLNKAINVYPNPVSASNKELFIDINLSVSNFHHISIINTTGTVIKRNVFEGNQRKIKIDVNDISKGMYILKIETSKKTFYKKIIIH